MATLADVKTLAAKNNPGADLTMLELAYDFAQNAHQGQKRLDGTDYVSHAVETAYTLAQMNLDLDTITAGFLHDVPEDTAITLDRKSTRLNSSHSQISYA